MALIFSLNCDSTTIYDVRVFFSFKQKPNLYENSPERIHVIIHNYEHYTEHGLNKKKKCYPSNICDEQYRLGLGSILEI